MNTLQRAVRSTDGDRTRLIPVRVEYSPDLQGEISMLAIPNYRNLKSELIAMFPDLEQIFAYVVAIDANGSEIDLDERCKYEEVARRARGIICKVKEKFVTIYDCDSFDNPQNLTVRVDFDWGEIESRIKTSFDESKDIAWAYYGGENEDPETLAAHLGPASTGRRSEREERELEKERARRRVSRAMDWKKFLAESSFVIVKYK